VETIICLTIVSGIVCDRRDIFSVQANVCLKGNCYEEADCLGKTATSNLCECIQALASLSAGRWIIEIASLLFVPNAHAHNKNAPNVGAFCFHSMYLGRLLAGLILGRGLLGHGLLHLLAALLARLGTLGALLVEKLLSAQ
jgi:hypothetical protein